MTLPSPSGSCPAARSSFAETGLRDPPLGKMRPAIAFEAKQCDVFEKTRALTVKNLLWKSQEGFQTKTSFFEL